MSKRLLPCLAALAFALAATAPARADTPLTADQQQLLETLDPQLAQECVQVAQQLDGWRKDIAAVRRVLTNPPPAKEDVDRAWKVAEALAKRSGAFKKAVRFADALDKRFKKVEAEVQAAQYDPNNLLNLSEDDFRAKVRAEVRARLVGPLLDDLKPVLDWIDAAKDPAQFAKNFVESELTKYLDNPYPVGDDFKLRVSKQDYKKSLFAKDAGLVVTLEYKGGVRVKATGLYFRYRKGQLPEPVFDKTRMQVDASGLASALTGTALKAIADNLPDLGPISLKGQPTFSGFDGGKPGSISFRIAVNFSQLADFGLDQLPSAEGDITLSANGKAKLASLQVTIPDAVTVPVGPALALQGGAVEVRPDDKKETVRIKTRIISAAGGKESLSMKCTAAFGFPITKTGIHFTGQLVAGDQAPVGTVEAWLTKEKLKVHLTAPDPTSPVAKLAPYKIDCTGQMDVKGLTAKGTIEALYGAGKMDMDLFIGTNGYGSFTVSDNLDLGPVKAQGSLQASFRPGLSHLTVDGCITLEVGTDYFDVLQAVVKLHAETSPKPVIVASASVGPVTLECKVGNFKELYDALKKSIQQGRAQVYDYLAQRERAAGKYGAEREAALRNAISDLAKKNGLDHVSIDGGGPIDKALGDAAANAKRLGGMAADARDQLGGMAADGRKNVENGLSQLDPTNPGGAVGQVFGGGGGGIFGRGDISEPLNVGKVFGLTGGFDHAVNDANKDLHKFLDDVARRRAMNARLNKLAAALASVNLHKKQHGRSGEAAELRLRIDRVKAHPDGASDAVVTFFVQTCSFRQKIDAHGSAQKPATAADGRVGEIRIAGLFGKGKPRATVNVPKLANQAPWDAEALLRDHLAELVERNLPTSEFGGRFEERALAVHNGSPEPITVWLQVESKADGGKWSWLPSGRGEERPAFRFTVPAHQTVPLKCGESPVALHSLRARLWAESESGLVWGQYMRTDLLLVDEKDDGGEHRYFSDRMQYFVFTFNAAKGPRVLHERLISVRNDTAEPLLVNLRAHTHDYEGKAIQDSTGKPARVEPGKTLRLRHPGGLALRGSEVQVWAEDAGGHSFRWVKHEKAPVALTDKNGYRGEAIGTALFVFEASAKAGAGAPALNAAQATFALPADQVKVPAVTKETVAAAAAALQKVGLRAAPPRNAGPKDTVLKQEPAAGTWHPPGTEVVLTTANSTPKPNPDKPKPAMVKVPAVEGKSFAEAKKLLEEEGLAWKTVNPPENGTVTKVTPAVGTMVNRGETVVLTFPTQKAKPTPVEGKLTGTWTVSPGGAHVRFEDKGVVEVGHPPTGGGAPKTWVKGRYTHEHDTLTLDGGGLKVEGRLRWVTKEKFTVTTGAGKEFTFEMHVSR
jgi:hypothetical protein